MIFGSDSGRLQVLLVFIVVSCRLLSVVSCRVLFCRVVSCDVASRRVVYLLSLWPEANVRSCVHPPPSFLIIFPGALVSPLSFSLLFRLSSVLSSP